MNGNLLHLTSPAATRQATRERARLTWIKKTLNRDIYRGQRWAQLLKVQRQQKGQNIAQYAMFRMGRLSYLRGSPKNQSI